MSRIAYVNGRYLPHAAATVHIEDRGYQFADGIYEVVAVVNGALVDEEPHLNRMDRSLAELQIAQPMSRAALKVVIREVVRRNDVHNGIVYLQLTRGVAPRDHKFPKDAQTQVVAYARRKSMEAVIAQAAKGVRVITVPDIRWTRCDIKSVSLLPNILMKQRAVEAGCFEALQVDAAGMVTEGTSTNAWIVTAAGELVTRPATDEILNGVTRRSLLALAARNGLAYVERPFSVAEALAAREVFVSSATSFVMPVVALDGQPIAGGQIGPFCRKLLDWYLAYIRESGVPADQPAVALAMAAE